MELDSNRLGELSKHYERPPVDSLHLSDDGSVVQAVEAERNILSQSSLSRASSKLPLVEPQRHHGGIDSQLRPI